MNNAIGVDDSIITIGGLLSQLDIFKQCRILNKYEITELFEKHKERKYEINGVTADVEDGVAYFSDTNDLLNDTYVLNAIPLSEIVSISHDWKVDKDYYKAIIVLNDGRIIIEATM